MQINNLKKGIAGVILGTSLFGGFDAVKYDGKPVAKQMVMVKNEVVEVEQIGNVVETKLPWKGEQGLKVKYDLKEPTLAEKIKDKRTKEIITEKVNFQDNEAFKIDILLTEKPNTNKFCYQIEGYENYDFFYQPPLTEEEIAEGASRPEEIVGSYAIYHKTLKNHKVGEANYETGKFGHIPFPYIWEVGKENEKIRAEDLTYKDGELCVVAPQEYLDNADYSKGVRIDPTFGYTGNGVSNLTIGERFNSTQRQTTRAGRGVAGAAGTLTQIDVYLNASASISSDTYVAIDTEDGGGSGIHNNVALIERTNLAKTTTKTWFTFTAASQSLSAINYVLSVADNPWDYGVDGQLTRVSYDDTSTGNRYSEGFGLTSSTYALSKENPWTEVAQSTTITLSIYATYTADAPATINGTGTINGASIKVNGGNIQIK